MNLQIINAIVQRTNSVVSHTTDANAVTTYHLTKPVNGKAHTVSVSVAAELHAAADADTVANIVASDAAYQFAEARKAAAEAEQ